MICVGFFIYILIFLSVYEKNIFRAQFYIYAFSYSWIESAFYSNFLFCYIEFFYEIILSQFAKIFLFLPQRTHFEHIDILGISKRVCFLQFWFSCRNSHIKFFAWHILFFNFIFLFKHKKRYSIHFISYESYFHIYIYLFTYIRKIYVFVFLNWSLSVSKMVNLSIN